MLNLLRMIGGRIPMDKFTSSRSATEEDYKKRQNWNVGTFHRASTLPETEQSSVEEKKSEPPDAHQLYMHEKHMKRMDELFNQKNVRMTGIEDATKSMLIEPDKWLLKKHKRFNAQINRLLQGTSS
jgi:mannose-6-phosphate isomerase-like protein (cupin superfamily)